MARTSLEYLADALEHMLVAESFLRGMVSSLSSKTSERHSPSSGLSKSLEKLADTFPTRFERVSRRFRGGT